MGNSHEKEINVLEGIINVEIELPEYNSSICDEIRREILNKNSIHHQQKINEHDDILTSFIDKCHNKTLLGEITTQLYILPWYSQLAWILVYAVMLSVAIIGNLIVIWIIAAHRSMRTVTNLFLMNLAIADFLLASSSAAFNFVFLLNSHWPFGSRFCVISNVLANLTVATSVFTILAMIRDRFVAVIFPFRPRMTKKVAVSIIILVWTLSSLLCIPSFLYSTTITYNYSAVQQRTICYLQWPDGEDGFSYSNHIFNIVFLVLTYVVPLLCMAVTYPWISFILWRSKIIGENSDHQNQVVKSKQRVVYMLVTVMLLFAICWLPYHVYFLYIYYNREIIHTNFIHHVYLAIYWLAMSNSCYNPIVYYNMNARIRGYFQEALCIRSRSADVSNYIDGNKSSSLGSRMSTLTTIRLQFCRMTFSRRNAGNIVDTSV